MRPEEETHRGKDTIMRYADDRAGTEDAPGIRAPRSRDGFIHVELSERPVPYHIITTFRDAPDEGECHALALSSCRVACLTLDVARGQIAASTLRKAMTSPCLKRLETFTHLLGMQMDRNNELKMMLKYLPSIPHSITGMLVGPTAFEGAVHLSVGRVSFWTNLRFVYMGSRWMCAVADVG